MDKRVPLAGGDEDDEVEALPASKPVVNTTVADSDEEEDEPAPAPVPEVKKKVIKKAPEPEPEPEPVAEVKKKVVKKKVV